MRAERNMLLLLGMRGFWDESAHRLESALGLGEKIKDRQAFCWDSCLLFNGTRDAIAMSTVRDVTALLDVNVCDGA